MKLFPEQEVSNLYTIMDAIDKKISRLETFISLGEEKAEPMVTSREGMIQRPVENRHLSSTTRLSQKCDFKNCQASDHHTRQCDKNLKPGNVPEDILQMVKDANLCLRCLREQNWKGHQKSCVGGYKRPKDSEWVRTDCNTCFATLPSGETMNINKRICFHVQDTVKEKNQRKRDSSSVTSTPKTKRIKELKQEGDMGDEVAPQLGCGGTPNHTLIKFEKELGGASLVEGHQTEKGRSSNQLSEKNTTPGPESEKGIDTSLYNKIDSTSQGHLDWASEIVKQGNQLT